MREPDRISSRHIGFVDVLGVVAAVLLGVQSLNFIVTLISNFSATFMIFAMNPAVTPSWACWECCFCWYLR